MEGGRGATTCHNILLPSKVPKEWCNIPLCVAIFALKKSENQYITLKVLAVDLDCQIRKHIPSYSHAPCKIKEFSNLSNQNDWTEKYTLNKTKISPPEKNNLFIVLFLSVPLSYCRSHYVNIIPLLCHTLPESTFHHPSPFPPPWAPPPPEPSSL